MINPANIKGKELEDYVERELLNKKYQKITPPKNFLKYKSNTPIFAREFDIGNNIYGGSLRVDFILFHPQKWINCLVIECKNRTGTGSVDHKYPYLVENIENNIYKSIVILNNTYSPGEKSEMWLRNQAGINKKLTHVFDLSQFDQFVINNL